MASTHDDQASPVAGSLRRLYLTGTGLGGVAASSRCCVEALNHRGGLRSIDLGVTMTRSSISRGALVGALMALMAVTAGCSSTSSMKASKLTTSKPPATSTTIFNGNGPTVYAMPTGPDAQTMTAACRSLGSLQTVFTSVAASASVSPMMSVPTSQGSQLWDVAQLATATSSPQISQVRADATAFMKAWQSDQASPEAPPAIAKGPAVGLAMISQTMMAWSQLSVDCGGYGLSTS